MAGSRIVVKVGSSLLTNEGGGLDRGFIGTLAGQVATLRSSGKEVVVVTSGAIAAGTEALGMASRPQDIPSLQAAASVGQTCLIGAYAGAFSEHGLVVGQVLVTRHDTGHRQQYLHARDTFDRLLTLGAVPVVNENDTTAVDEIRFGDNDTLAAIVATMIRADLVVMLTDTEGLYTSDPRVNEEADLLERVEELTDEMVAGAGGAGSDVGTGGMATKVEAARVLMKAGIDMVLCDGRLPGVLADVADGGSVGTLFSGADGQMKSRKLWIALGMRSSGTVAIDAGAKKALVDHGKSLLPAGVVGVTGEFEVGDTVVLEGPGGEFVARGITAMSSADLDRVKGMRTADIPSVLPGYAGEEVVHRDYLVVL